MSESVFVFVEEAAKIAGCSKPVITKACKSGEIPAHKEREHARSNARWIMRRADVEAWNRERLGSTLSRTTVDHTVVYEEMMGAMKRWGMSMGETAKELGVPESTLKKVLGNIKGGYSPQRPTLFVRMLFWLGLDLRDVVSVPEGETLEC